MNEKQYLKEQREKILIFWRELKNSWEITEKQLQDTYFNLFIKK
jgi:hypothetical protein